MKKFYFLLFLLRSLQAAQTYSECVAIYPDEVSSSPMYKCGSDGDYRYCSTDRCCSSFSWCGDCTNSYFNDGSSNNLYSYSNWPCRDLSGRDNTEDADSTDILFMLFGIISGICFIVTFICCYCRKKRNQQKQREMQEKQREMQEKRKQAVQVVQAQQTQQNNLFIQNDFNQNQQQFTPIAMTNNQQYFPPNPIMHNNKDFPPQEYSKNEWNEYAKNVPHNQEGLQNPNQGNMQNYPNQGFNYPSNLPLDNQPYQNHNQSNDPLNLTGNNQNNYPMMPPQQNGTNQMAIAYPYESNQLPMETYNVQTHNGNNIQID